MRVALVHDWLTGMRGGERVLDRLARRFPGADLHTLVHVPGATSPAIDALRVHTSLLNGLPGIARHYRKLLPLHPFAARRMRLRDYDLVISVSHAVAKSVSLPERIPHLCYCLTPMRYVWDQTDVYLGRGARRALATPLVGALRRFDVAHSGPDQVTRFVAISRSVADRVRRHYGRDARIVHPPVELDRFQPQPKSVGDDYLLIGGFVPYKREEIAIEAFARLGRRLVVVGDGPTRRRLAANAPPNVHFTGRIDDEDLASRLASCRALVHPQEEDFGIAAVEAQAAGRPVIALGAGGALDTVRPGLRILASGATLDLDDAGATGVLFETQDVPSLMQAVLAFEADSQRFDSKRIRDHAERFSDERFLRELQTEIGLTLEGRG
ncbi:MAG: glycosyltransferase [Deltaproteobacteria bacterium]|jgi:glycosyltransferase involved in cell wall biosynthesis|nr:glycosyltransferase [Deltaproteobacteria bacterium]